MKIEDVRVGDRVEITVEAGAVVTGEVLTLPTDLVPLIQVGGISIHRIRVKDVTLIRRPKWYEILSPGDLTQQHIGRLDKDGRRLTGITYLHDSIYLTWDTSSKWERYFSTRKVFLEVN